MKKILVVEDEKLLQKNIKELLQTNGLEVLTAGTKNEAIAYIMKYLDIHLFLLDIWLPDGDGFELLEIIRNRTIAPVIFLTACDDEESVVKGLNMGADDYICKPFRAAELISRIQANLRRTQRNANQVIRESGDLRLDQKHAMVYKNGKELRLGAMEYELLSILMANPGILIKRERLIDGIWDASKESAEDNTLSVNMSRLRKKIGNEYIETIRGFGYRFIKEVHEILI